jgi:hypothetical protein
MLSLIFLLSLGGLNAGDFPTFRDAVVECMVRNESVLTVPRKVNSAYAITEPLPSWPGGRLIIQGEGDGSLLYLRGKGRICIEGCVLKLRDVRVYGDPRDPPDVGVCFRRSSDGQRKAQSINGCGMRDVTVDGHYRQMAVFVFCAEGSRITDSRINNSIGHGLVYDSNDRYGLNFVADSGNFTNTGHSLTATEIAVWNSTERDVFPLVIAGFTDSFVGQSLYITATNCRAYVCVESYPLSFSRGNVPRWNTLDSCGWETSVGKAPKYGVLYRATGGQTEYPDTLKKLPALRWQTGPATGQEMVP